MVTPATVGPRCPCPCRCPMAASCALAAIPAPTPAAVVLVPYVPGPGENSLQFQTVPFAHGRFVIAGYTVPTTGVYAIVNSSITGANSGCGTTQLAAVFFFFFAPSLLSSASGVRGLDALQHTDVHARRRSGQLRCGIGAAAGGAHHLCGGGPGRRRRRL